MKYLILAGGSGTRLWPLSRKKYAKQFLKLIDDNSMLQNTAKRVSKEDGNDIFIITSKNSQEIINNQMGSIFNEFKHRNLIIEPIGRNTAPAIAYSTLFLSPDDVVVILSSDHHIIKSDEFSRVLSLAEDIAKKDYIVTLGIIPASPKTGYGYIKKSDKTISEAFLVDRFVEKPNKQKAIEYLEDGNYFWNAGIFIFKVDFFLSELKKYSPNIYSVLQKLKVKIDSGNNISESDFLQFENISIDYALMEKSERIAVIPSDIGWNDVGSFNSLYEIAPHDKDNSVIKCEKEKFINIGSKNMFVYGGDRVISAINLNNLIIVDTDDSILISDINSSEKIKEVVVELEKTNSIEITEPIITYKEWGNIRLLKRENNMILSEITILPSSEIKTRFHKYHTNNITIVSGEASIVKNNNKNTLKETESIFIPSNCSYSVSNSSKTNNLKFIEIKIGKYIDNSDVYYS